MGNYFKKEFQASKFLCEHHSPSDFYLSCWQSNRSPLPLLCIRTFIFLGCLAILIASLILTGMAINIGFWFIYLTHWGLTMITVASGCAFVVSLRAYMKGPIEASFELPWYVKTFWAVYDIAVCIAFFITIYYYALLAVALDEIDYAVNEVLDFFIHGMNSILMFILLMTSRHPVRMLHFIYPLGFGIIYLIFTVIFYFAGGTDPFGNKFIYPTLDWADPGPTSIALIVTALFLIIMHVIVVGITLFRNWVARRYCGGRKTGNMDLSPGSNIAYSY